MREIIIFGSNSLARIIVEAVEKDKKYKISGFIDDDKIKGSLVSGYEVLGNQKALVKLFKSGVCNCIVAIGDCRQRRIKTEQLKKIGFKAVSVIHPDALIGKGVSVGAGTYISAAAVIEFDVSIGSGVLINSNVLVAHETKIGNFAHIAGGVNCGGRVTIGDNSLVGMGTTIITGVSVGKDVFICAGSLVTQNIPDNVKVAGVPARIIGKIKT